MSLVAFVQYPGKFYVRSNFIKRPVPVYYCDVYRISHEAKGVSHGKEDAAVLSVHTCITGEFYVRSKVTLKLSH